VTTGVPTAPVAHPRGWTLIALLMVAVLLVASAGFLFSSVRPALSVSLTPGPAQGSNLSVDVGLTGGSLPLTAQVGLIPGSIHAFGDGTVLYFEDPTYPALYGPSGDIFAMGVRVGSYLELMGADDRIQPTTALGLPTALSAHPHGTLVEFGYGILPDFVYSANYSMLRYWLLGGGTLLWAGGPLAYSEGHALDSGGFQYEPMKWSGQWSLLGFPLSDPYNLTAVDTTGFPALYATGRTALGDALGLTYQGSVDGANVTQLVNDHGAELGSQAPPQRGGASARTSIAFVPVGEGGIYYFGGGLFDPRLGYVPQSSVNLSLDAATIIGLGYVPAPGSAASAAIYVAPFSAESVHLTITAPVRGAFVLVRSQQQGALLFFWTSPALPSPPSLMATSIGPAIRRPAGLAENHGPLRAS
jgi:hypothetical protein